MTIWDEHYERWQRGDLADDQPSGIGTFFIIALLLLILWRVW